MAPAPPASLDSIRFFAQDVSIEGDDLVSVPEMKETELYRGERRVRACCKTCYKVRTEWPPVASCSFLWLKRSQGTINSKQLSQKEGGTT